MKSKALYKVREVSNLREMLIQSVELFGTKTAFKLKVCKDPIKYKEISFKEYSNDISALGTSLLNLDLKDSTINLISGNRYEWAVSYLSIVNGLGIISPLDKSLTSIELKSLVCRSGSKAIIFDSSYLQTIYELMDNTSMHNLQYYICMDKIDDDRIIYFYDLISEGKKILEANKNEYNNLTIDNEKCSILLFTSGTTAQSKAVMLSHKNIITNILDCESFLNVNENDVTLSFLPLHHTFECTAGFLLMIYCGATICYCDGIRHFAKNINEYGVSAMICVPALFENMYKKLVNGIKENGKWEKVQTAISLFNGLDKLGINTMDLRRKSFKDIYSKLSPNLRLFVSGAAAVSKDVVKGFNDLGIMFFQGYGLTETSPVIACENKKYHRPGSVGLPLPSCEVKIENPDDNRYWRNLSKISFCYDWVLPKLRRDK